MDKKLVIFNLKMNAPVLADWRKIGKSKADVVVCPPFTHIEKLKKELPKNVKLGGQNVFWENSGAYTGEISPTMLKNSGAEYVIIGHSERRKYLGETDEMINKKVLAALKAGLKVVLCVGENSIIRKRGIKAVKNFIKNQLQKDLKGLVSSFKFSAKGGSASGGQASNLIIAYEPVWAIGTGKACNPENAIEMVKFIRNFVSSKFQVSGFKMLYGGSVNSKNISDFVKYADINGVLVGSASLKPKEVIGIIKKVEAIL